MKQLLEDEVTIESLSDIFESAFIKVVDKTSESFKIQCENINPKITIDEGRKFLSFGILYMLSGKISLSEAVLLTNKINDEFIFIRLSAIEYEGDIYIDSKYYMTFETGLIAFQLIHIAKKFEKFTVDALREYFDDYL